MHEAAEQDIRSSNQNLEMSQDMLFMNSNVPNLKANFPNDGSNPFKSLSPLRKADKTKNSSCVTLEKVKQNQNEKCEFNGQDSTIKDEETKKELEKDKKLADQPNITA